MSLDQLIDIARAEREQLRWLVLAALWHARPYGATEDLLLRCAAEIPLRAGVADVRRELDWLAKRELVTLDRDGPVWQAAIDAAGEDVYDHRVPAPSGLARPPKW
jgi:hypothetical protein